MSDSAYRLAFVCENIMAILFAVLWTQTCRPIEEVLFWSILGALFGTMLFGTAIEEINNKRNKRRKRNDQNRKRNRND